MPKCSCCNAPDKNKRGCSCTGGKSHQCLNMAATDAPASSIIAPLGICDDPEEFKEFNLDDETAIYFLWNHIEIQIHIKCFIKIISLKVRKFYFFLFWKH